MRNCKTCTNEVTGKQQYCDACNKLRMLAFHENSRARRLGIDGVIDPDAWIKMCQAYNYQCLRCGSKQRLSIDHVQALISGGLNTLENIQPLCVSCNTAKTYNVDYRGEPLPIREKRWEFLAERRSQRHGRQGQITLTYCLSGIIFETICLQLISQGIEPTKDAIARLTRTWIYEAIEAQIGYVDPSNRFLTDF